MSDRDEQLENFEARLMALTQLVLSHIVASDDVLPGLAEKTARYAGDQRDAAREEGKHRAALLLDDMLVAIRATRDVSANDP